MNESTGYETIHASNVPFNQYSETENQIKFLISDMNGNIAVSSPYTVKIGSITVSAYTDGTPDVPPATVGQGTTGNCLGTFKFDGAGTISSMTITEYGTCDADGELENVKLFKDNGNGNWNSGDDTTQLGSTTTFNASNKATFSGFSLTASTYCYVHMILDVKSTAQVDNTIGIGLYQNDIVCTSTTTASSWPVQLSSSTIKDLTSPAAITDLTGLCDSGTGDVTLSWSTPGDDGWNNTLVDGSKYRIDYSTYSIAWSTNTFDVDIPTHSVTPHTQVSHTITGLTSGTSYYFRIWTADEIPLWSGLSNGCTVWVEVIVSSVTVSAYTAGTPDVPPIYTQSTGNCLGTFEFDGTGTITQLTITEYGTCDADGELENVKLYEDNGDGNWEPGQDTQLGSPTDFDVNNEATFSFSLAASTYCYVHVVLDVKSTADSGGTVGIELYQNDIVCTSTTTSMNSEVKSQMIHGLLHQSGMMIQHLIPK